MYRFFRFILEFIAGFVAIFIVLGSLLIWRLSSSPMSSTFLTPYVETAIESLIPGVEAHIFASALIWDNADRKIALRAEDVRLNAEDGAPIATVPSLDISISLASLVAGKLMPAGLMIDHPQVKLTRAADNRFYFGGLTATGNPSGENIRGTLAGLANDAAHAFLMRKLQITRAVFDVHDEKNNRDWSLAIPDIELERVGGDLAGEARVEVTQKDQTALLAVHYAYDRQKERHDLTARFSDINPSFLAGSHAGTIGAIPDLPLTGAITAEFDSHLNIVAGALDIHGDPGTLDYTDFWEQPRAVKSLDLKAAYDESAHTLDVSQAVIDFGGPVLAMTLKGTPPAAQTNPPHDLDFVLTLTLDHLPMDDYGALWPKSIIPDPREWIATHMSKGEFNHGEAVFKGSLSWNDLANLTLASGGGKLTASGATVMYLEGMPPVENANAAASFDLDHMTIETSGNTGDLAVLPSTITMKGFLAGDESIELPLRLSGPLPTLLHVIDNPPLNYAKAIGLDPDAFTGKIDGMLTLRFPLWKGLTIQQVDVKATATLTDVTSTKLLPGYAMTQGAGTLDLDKTGFTLKDSVSINKVPVKIDWRESFLEGAGQPQRQMTATGAVTGDQWTQLGFAPLGKTKGPIAVTLDMQQTDKKPTLFIGSLDMGKAEIAVDPLNWKKPAGVAALLTFAATRPPQGPIDVKSITLKGPRLSVKGSAVLGPDTLEPETINFDPFVLGRTNAALHFSRAPGADGVLNFEVSGKSFDVSGLRGGKDPDRAAPRPKEYHLKLDTLYTGDIGHIDNVRGFAIRDGEGWNAISLQGLADGGPPLDIELTSGDGGRRIFSASCDDFGRALKGLGFTDTVSGGKVEITGESLPDNPRAVEGKVKIGSFEAQGLPVLVTLMNATSPFGFFNLITGTMSFDQLEGKFRWQGDQLELNHVRAVGSSVGMNVDGRIDMNTGAANLNGTIAPFSLFNRLLNYIPLIGGMLTGGENQGVLAANFTIKGTLDKPDVNVNPVSLLAPGFLRNLFFGGGDEDSSKDAGDNAPKPEDQTPPAATNFNKSP